MPTNAAAWIPARNRRLEVGPAPYPTPGPDEIVVRNHAVAVNPVDWVIQVAGRLAYMWLKYPAVLGADVAGEVVEAGSAVTRFRPGDRVLALAVGTDRDANSPAQGAYQQYTVVLERLASAIPESMPFTDAAVLPLGLSTAACALFQTTHLGLHHPAADAEPTGETVLIWGGSTSVGLNAVQLAVASGYEVITTASPRNAELLTSLGAARVFDYRSPTVESDIIKTFSDRTMAGAVAIGPGSSLACVRIAAAARGRRFVSAATAPVTFENGFSLLPTVTGMAGGMAKLQWEARRRGVGVKFIFGSNLKKNEVGPAIFRDFLPAALASGHYRPLPAASVVGTSLADLQDAMDQQRRGVSATKLVVTLH
ncbi:zinc-binding alcohol dehydrogenase family protein [Actinoplanes bogorensis]|uniref:Zinc-binding alcohol dehydrogenase family protein n=1 Tax=Paractinoplanes bogorensis TaxID=1610840 RepID=A0ABS5YKK2_9ACTN|nr:zinc-binding alcohol dehydrogenase family protein [Actinoplanes bogorensis]MBU2664003.1 zinc-binding alcohol dehydrogenase family protein [Actinoplanes bogorensis]